MLGKSCFIIIFVLLTLGCRVYTTTTDGFQSTSYHLRKAERYTREQKLSKAIKSYHNHIAERLELQTRPDWENPYFYLLIIGDLHLEEGNVNDALQAYEEAENMKVNAGLISDRYRYVAHWYAERKRFQEAIDILTKYRKRDELLFDLTRDRIARAMIEEEEAQEKSKKKLPIESDAEAEEPVQKSS